MATYGQLLIDAGGGIVDRGRQSDRQDGASVIIGLGGTGADAVIKLKQEIYKQLRPDDADAVIPRYEAVRYLIIDADDSQVAPSAAMTDIDKNTEFFPLSNSSIKSTFEAKEILKTRPELYWLDYENISIDEASKGAGGIRQVGRFLLVDKGEALYAKMKSVIEGALTAAKTGELDIHICSGLSGGTGSGIFLDVCYLVRRILKQIGKQEARVSGYFFLPDVNLSVPVISENPLISAYIKVNGYAALQELDYCMNFAKNKDSFRMNYGFAEVDFSMNPVDLCYLISTTDASGNRVQNGYQYAMGVVTDYIISFLAKETSGFTLESHIANLNSMKEGIRVQHGAALDYNILGASVAEMPLTEIATYLGCELFEGYRELFGKVPAEKERDEFLAKMRLGYEDLQKEVSHGCVPAVVFGKAYDAKMYEQGGSHPFEQRAEQFLSDNIGTLEKNAKTMMEAMDEFAVPKAGTSLISRTYKGLFDSFVTSMDYGPFYAGRLLSGGDNQNLIHAVDGFLKKNGELLEHELRQTRLREDEYKDAALKMENTNFLNKKTRMDSYLQALTGLYAHHYRVELYKSMDMVLQEYKRQLRRLYQNLFRVLMQVLDTLRETFEVNKTVLSQKGVQDHLYTWKILSIPDVVEGLKQEFKEHDLGQTLYHLMLTLFEHCSAWISQDENEIRKLISDFILEEFDKATKRTMTDYLKEKFRVENPALLAEAVEKEIIRDKLGKDSTPLFWKNPMYQNSMGMHSYLTVPYDAAEIKMAAKNFINRQMEFTVRESHITDKLSMMRFYSGLPIFAYQGIMELQRAYEEDKKAGRHLFERGAVNWNLLPPPVPWSFKIDLPVERLAQRGQALIAEFERAEAAGVVVKDEFFNWNILKTKELSVAAWVEELGGIQTNGKNNPKKIRDAIAAMKEKLEHAMQAAQPVRIEYLNTVSGSERQVMLDFYLLAPVLQALVHDELQKREDAQRQIAQLEQLAQDTVREKRTKNDFFNAIFTGVLSYGKKVVFSYDEFGMQKSVELCNSSMKYGQSGAYQAYLTYSTLDAALREKIDSRTKALMDEEDSSQVCEAVEALEQGMPKKIQGYLGIYDELDPVHEEMEAFYMDFMKTLHNFKLNM
ncbi:MAG: tubulin-like doman-containing protein [Eubacterium sp.]|nr:tubulin-like doman-containing protein [Eubacterium sp.]